MALCPYPQCLLRCRLHGCLLPCQRGGQEGGFVGQAPGAGAFKAGLPCGVIDGSVARQQGHGAAGNQNELTPPGLGESVQRLDGRLAALTFRLTLARGKGLQQHTC